MLGSWRVVVFSVLGFALPVGAAVYVAPLVFKHAANQIDSDPAELIARKRSPEILTGKGDEQLTIEAGSSFASVRSDSALEVSPNFPFVVSLLVRFAKLPSGDDRHVFLAKYTANTAPYAGWAFAVHRLSTSLRPEIYWKGADGRGGWYSFERVNLRTDQWYSFTLVLSKDQLLSLYLQELTLDADSTRLLSQTQMLNKTSDRKGPLEYLGGYDLSEIQLPRTLADLNFGAIRAGDKAFQGEISSVLIAAPVELPRSRKKLQAFLEGGPKKIHSHLGVEDVKLWISERGIDESSFARPTNLSGGAQWTKSGGIAASEKSWGKKSAE